MAIRLIIKIARDCPVSKGRPVHAGKNIPLMQERVSRLRIDVNLCELRIKKSGRERNYIGEGIVLEIQFKLFLYRIVRFRKYFNLKIVPLPDVRNIYIFPFFF
jgi:hypothetical protein